MIPNEDMMEMMRLLRDRHFKALKKVCLMELLLTMDLPRGRIPLTPSNVRWLLRNVQINNGTHPDLERIVRLLKEFANDAS